MVNVVLLAGDREVMIQGNAAGEKGVAVPIELTCGLIDKKPAAMIDYEIIRIVHDAFPQLGGGVEIPLNFTCFYSGFLNISTVAFDGLDDIIGVFIFQFFTVNIAGVVVAFLIIYGSAGLPHIADDGQLRFFVQPLDGVSDIGDSRDTIRKVIFVLGGFPHVGKLVAFPDRLSVEVSGKGLRNLDRNAFVRIILNRYSAQTVADKAARTDIGRVFRMIKGKLCDLAVTCFDGIS